MENAKRLAKKEALQDFLAKNTKDPLLLQLLKGIVAKTIAPIRPSRVATIKNEEYIVSSDEKAWSLDFLSYILKERPVLTLALFDKKDRREIVNFVRNKVFTALLSKLHINDLFDKGEVVLRRMYEAFSRRIRFEQEYYILKHSDKEYRLPINHFEYPVFFHRLGLPELPQQALAQIRGRDVIDGGAYIGDSVLVLEELTPRAIYAFEPLKESFVLLNKTVYINRLRNVTPLKMALGTTKGKTKITPFGSASFRSDIFGEDVGEDAEVISIDDFVMERGAQVGLIKLDVEGSELDVLLGAKETIKEYKPVLIVSVYHRGQDFFEIPKLIKEIEPQYKMRFLNLNRTHATFERVVLAYVERH
jgi:FkbM family methyltransferase